MSQREMAISYNDNNNLIMVKTTEYITNSSIICMIEQSADKARF